MIASAALDLVPVLAPAAGEQREGDEGVVDRIAPGPVLTLLLGQVLPEALADLLGAVAVMALVLLAAILV